MNYIRSSQVRRTSLALLSLTVAPTVFAADCFAPAALQPVTGMSTEHRAPLRQK